MLTNYSNLNWKPVHDLVFIRELPVTLDSVIIPEPLERALADPIRYRGGDWAGSDRHAGW